VVRAERSPPPELTLPSTLIENYFGNFDFLLRKHYNKPLLNPSKVVWFHISITARNRTHARNCLPRAAFWLQEHSDAGLSETLQFSSPSHCGRQLCSWLPADLFPGSAQIAKRPWTVS